MLVLIFIYGLLIGSFLNVCVYRIPREESIVFPPSHCMKCNTKIKPYDLIPVISWLLLRGKCRGCGEKISIRYPFVELGTGLLLMFVYSKYGLSTDFFKYAVLIGISIVIGLIDLDTTDVYFKTTMTGIVIGILFIGIGAFQHTSIWSPIFGGMLGGGLIAIIILLTHGMGWGDFEICLMAGLYLGLKLTAVMLFLSFILGGAIGLLLVLTKIKSRKDYIPFGPFIVLGTFLAILFGNNMIDFYCNTFLK